MLTLALRGLLVLIIFVSLLMIPLQLRLPADEALYYCLQSIAAMTWLWLAAVPLVALATWISHWIIVHRH